MSRLPDFGHPEHLHTRQVRTLVTLVTPTEVNWVNHVDRSKWPEPDFDRENPWWLWSETDPARVFAGYADALKAARRDPPNSYAVACIEDYLTRVAMRRLRQHDPERWPFTTRKFNNLQHVLQQQAAAKAYGARVFSDRVDAAFFAGLVGKTVNVTLADDLVHYLPPPKKRQVKATPNAVPMAVHFLTKALDRHKRNP